VPFQVPVGFRWRKVAFIALNLPPATVWLLEPEPAMERRLAA
jgi:phospholipid N-methyltransferase